jgi:hypothetical protein
MPGKVKAAKIENYLMNRIVSGICKYRKSPDPFPFS